MVVGLDKFKEAFADFKDNYDIRQKQNNRN